MNPEELGSRVALSTGSGIVYWMGVYINALRVRRCTGRSPNLKPSGTRERVLWGSWFFVILNWIFLPLILKGPLHYETSWTSLMIEPPPLHAGLLLLLAGYGGTLWCYSALGYAWRIGVNSDEDVSLVTRGPYRFVRHPIYLFQTVMLLGVFLLLPVYGFLVVILVQFISAHVKAKDEESFLLGKTGDDYRAYMERTGRFLPRIYSRPGDLKGRGR